MQVNHYSVINQSHDTNLTGKVNRKALIRNEYNQIPHLESKEKEGHTHKLINVRERHAQKTKWTAPPQTGGHSVTLNEQQ